jgi:creatinine amidohydrolase
MDVFALPHDQARRVLATGAPVFFPVNPVEYHGPHLSLLNDGVVSAGLCRDLHAALAARHPEWPFLEVPDPCVGSGTVPGPGSRPIPFHGVRGVVVETCKALVALGATRVVLMTFHGDPLHNQALQAGVDWLQAHGARGFAPMPLLMSQFLRPDASMMGAVLDGIADPSDRAVMQADLPFDFHAGFGETSLALHYAPETVSDVRLSLPPCPALVPPAPLAAVPGLARTLGRAHLADELRFGALLLAWLALRPFPAYTTRPSLANAASGKALASLIVQRYAEAAEAVLVNGAPSPRGHLPWVKHLTLGGRIDLAKVGGR